MKKVFDVGILMVFCLLSGVGVVCWRNFHGYHTGAVMLDLPREPVIPVGLPSYSSANPFV